jgi:hypothetical protein
VRRRRKLRRTPAPKRNLAYLREYEEQIILRDLRELCRDGAMVSVKEMRLRFPMRYGTMLPTVLKRMHKAGLISRTYYAVYFNRQRSFKYGPPVAEKMRRAA